MSSEISQNSQGENLLGEARAPVVVVRDENEDRCEAIAQIITSCGAAVRVVQDMSEIDEVDHVGGGVAVVALGAGVHPDKLSFAVIRELKARNHKIITHGDNLFSWPIGLRCRVLLDGALLLLDAASKTFTIELRSALAKLLQDEKERHQEELRIKQEMERLGIVGTSPQMVSVFRSAVRFATLSDFPVLISGETGTGKELIANSLHRLDTKRSKGPFVVANCSAINSGIAESELFGHRRGSFTGADVDRKGFFRSAHGGVLFLDEIGDLSQSLQAKLLRVLQEDRVLAVGSDREVEIDVRVIAATNKNLEQMVKEGSFREDLYHRLNVLSLHIPPLRERPADLQPLIEHFLRKYSSLNQSPVSGVNADFVGAVRQMTLSGNARQLENIITRALVNAGGKSSMSLNDLTTAEWQQLSSDEGSARAITSQSDSTNAQAGFSQILDLNDWNLSKSLDYCECALLKCALQFTQGNQTQTARLMGITPRSVYNKIQKYKLRYH